MLPTQLFEIFHEVLISEPDVREAALADVEACRERVRVGWGEGRNRCVLLQGKMWCVLQLGGLRHLKWSS
jgi:hypothetical protein